MKTATTRLKKLKTKTVYGFKKGHLETMHNLQDPTTISTTSTMVLI